ncbi:hypothetical protein FISHEDRAFT_53087 [Fistulina hepatica ATCC 64428]|nr:hypothetical protein FISHEDRAFT_53087 [Fistulina hepatica ATCC 64428]
MHDVQGLTHYNVPPPDAVHDDDAPGDEEADGDQVMEDEDDSSEEGDDDEEEARKIREGFIVDEDEEEEEEKHDQRRKRRKKHHRHRQRDDDILEDDDLELLEENTGTSFKKNRLTRLRRASPQPTQALVSSDDDLDDEGDARTGVDLERIWDDDRGGRDDEDDFDEEDDFIEYDDEDDGGALDEEARERRRKEREQERLERKRRARVVIPELAGIDANAWEEIHDVFGDGREYDWALEEDVLEDEYERPKGDISYQEVFEPSEIRARMLTEDDDLIRQADTPERMQLVTSTLAHDSSLALHAPLPEEELEEAAMWVISRLPSRLRDHLVEGGSSSNLGTPLIEAVAFVLKSLFIDEMEVPYIWLHKRDYLGVFDANDAAARLDLGLPDLWRIYNLGLKYRALSERKKALDAVYQRYGVHDEYFEEDLMGALKSVEMVADATEWLTMKHKDQRLEEDVHGDEEPKMKKPSRISAYEVAKKGMVGRLARGFGIEPSQVVSNYTSSMTVHYPNDLDINPIAYAEQFLTEGMHSLCLAQAILASARMIMSTELGKDPILREEIRKLFKDNSLVSVRPTERGITKIDEHHPYYVFKYLDHKPINEFLESTQFLHILAAEADHLVTVAIELQPDQKATFERRLNEAIMSDAFGETAKAWNEERVRIVHEVLEHHLLSAGAKWAKEYIREEEEDLVSARCSALLRERIDIAPWCPRGSDLGATPTVLALSWGKGDPQRDAITVVFLDEEGRLREHTNIDNLADPSLRTEFIDLVSRREPDVIVISGFSIATLKLSEKVKKLLHAGTRPESEVSAQDKPAFDIPVIYGYDDVARIYQHSKRAEEEFSTLTQIARYCVGLARYTQNPLNEFAALGADITAIAFEEEDQHLVPREKLLAEFERALVDTVNKIGVDINRAVTDDYYQMLLPFVCGLGPRKAQVLIKKIVAKGGSLVNRNQFVKGGLLTTKVFLNAAAFLKITAEDARHNKKRRDAEMEEDAPDPLDGTRVHPEDYDLARKMATDALELDEEDVHDEHPSHVINLIMQDTESEHKLSELNLDEFANSLLRANQDRKRHTLNLIRGELVHPFAEKRRPFPPMMDWEVVTMLSGETDHTLKIGLIVSVMVTHVTREQVFVQLDSGIEGFISAQYIADDAVDKLQNAIVRRQTLSAVIIEVRFSLQNDHIRVSLSSRQSDVGGGDNQFRRVRPDTYFNHAADTKDREILQRKKHAEVDRTRRVIKHPNFHNFSSSQAEAFLAKQQRGDVVIRPSSKGVNHLAVTWKVDDQLYQHIDVTEPNADPTGQTVGGLIVDKNHTYSDLDELIVNHVQAMARKVEELMMHERFKPGKEDDLHIFLKNQLMANPAKSMYGFTLNRKRPGHFNLCFLANKNAAVQTWPVRVTPEAYYLFEAAAVGVPELCDAFKVRHLHESKNMANGGKTPYGAGGRTPARGHATPGHASVRHLGRTPNPMFARPFDGTTPVPNYGGATPASYPSSYPSLPLPLPLPPPPSGFARPPPGMNPERAAMIQQGGGWGGNGGWQ